MYTIWLSLTVFALEYVIHSGNWEVFLSKQVNYNQVVVKCQILQECFLQNFNMQKCQNMEHSNSRTFQGPTLFSRTFKGLEFFFSKFKDFSRTLWTLHSCPDSHSRWTSLVPPKPNSRLVQDGTKVTSPLRWLSPNCLDMPRPCNDSIMLRHITSCWRYY